MFLGFFIEYWISTEFVACIACVLRFDAGENLPAVRLSSFDNF